MTQIEQDYECELCDLHGACVCDTCNKCAGTLPNCNCKAPAECDCEEPGCPYTH